MLTGDFHHIVVLRVFRLEAAGLNFYGLVVSGSLLVPLSHVTTQKRPVIIFV